MAKRPLFVLSLLTLAAATAAVLAAPRATLTLRNGDKLQTDLVDLGGVGFTVRSGGKTDTIAEAEVAFIDFAGGAIPAPEIKAMQDGGPFIALRNGDIVNGRLTDIGGNDPLRLTVRTPNGNQDFSSNDVARIFLAKWNGMPAPAAVPATVPAPAPVPPVAGSGRGRARGQGQAQGRAVGQVQTITIPGGQCWVNTGIYVDAGQRVVFAASGEIQLGGDRNDIAIPAGSKAGRYQRNAPIPENFVGALIGRIDNRRAFGIGDQTQALGMPASGELWVGINQNRCDNNRGEFVVRINDR